MYLANEIWNNKGQDLINYSRILYIKHQTCCDFLGHILRVPESCSTIYLFRQMFVRNGIPEYLELIFVSFKFEISKVQSLGKIHEYEYLLELSRSFVISRERSKSAPPVWTELTLRFWKQLYSGSFWYKM